MTDPTLTEADLGPSQQRPRYLRLAALRWLQLQLLHQRRHLLPLNELQRVRHAHPLRRCRLQTCVHTHGGHGHRSIALEPVAQREDVGGRLDLAQRHNIR